MHRRLSSPSLIAVVLCALAPLSRTGAPLPVNGTLTGPVAARVQMVYIETAPGAFPLTTGVVIDQKNTKYSPHIAAVLAGSTVEFKTSDAQLHNVFVRQNGEMLTNSAMPPGVPNVRLTLDNPGIARVSCVVHKEMGAWILILQNPYFATVNAGAFTIPGLPPGKYIVKVWGEKLVEAEKAKAYSVEVKAGVPLAITL